MLVTKAAAESEAITNEACSLSAARPRRPNAGRFLPSRVQRLQLSLAARETDATPPGWRCRDVRRDLPIPKENEHGPQIAKSAEGSRRLISGLDQTMMRP